MSELIVMLVFHVSFEENFCSRKPQLKWAPFLVYLRPGVIYLFINMPIFVFLMSYLEYSFLFRLVG